MPIRYPSDAQWTQSRVETLPARWANRLLEAWQRETVADYRAANERLRIRTQTLQAVRLPLDASDRDVCDAADVLAKRCLELAQVYRQLPMLRQRMSVLVKNHGIQPPKQAGDKSRAGKAVDDGPAVARMTDPQWLRKGLRRMHAKEVEGAAIGLGYVHRFAEPYVSRETLVRRMQQNERNQAAMEATVLRNELDQEYTVAELAATGPANRAIRRAELMTRISGFERIAGDMEHVGLFLTITCPSRMHKWRTIKSGGKVVKVVENPRYDGTRPNEAQAYLAKMWTRIRSKLARAGIRPYGFRIAEPNHDATPHWHLLVFHDPAHTAALRAIIWHYALQDSPDEPGAHTHRVDFKPIDHGRGSAAGYIAKYVAKNIDGYRLEQDLIGNPALDTAARVEAWASSWRIRQFQQVGGPPVGVWRELRRIKTIPEGAPEFLKAAHRAVNKTAVIEGRGNACVAWDHYCKAQGGVFIGRNCRIKLAKAQREGLGRYGEPLADAVIGVECFTREIYTPEHMAHMGGLAERVVHWIAESDRHTWEVVSRGVRAQPERVRIAAPGGFFSLAAKPLAPWTCVNNCTTPSRAASESCPDRAHALPPQDLLSLTEKTCLAKTPFLLQSGRTFIRGSDDNKNP